MRDKWLPTRHGEYLAVSFAVIFSIQVKQNFQITDLQTTFTDERERVNAMISIMQSENVQMKLENEQMKSKIAEIKSENVQMKAKISKLESLSINDSNITVPGEEPCGYPCAEYISNIDARVSRITGVLISY